MVSRQGLIEFPCKFTIKVMGIYDSQFSRQITVFLDEQFADLEYEILQVTPSRQGNYLSATLVVFAENQKHLDDIYRALNVHPLVKMLL